MAKKNDPKRVLFLCTGNSCRSQMAEAIVNSCFKGEWKAYSAGTNSAGYVHPMAIQVLESIGLVHKGKSKHIDQFKDSCFDLVITVCDDAAEDCPLWLGSGQVVHHTFPDPAKSTGTDAEILEGFRQIRDEILEKMPSLLNNN